MDYSHYNYNGYHVWRITIGIMRIEFYKKERKNKWRLKIEINNWA